MSVSIISAPIDAAMTEASSDIIILLLSDSFLSVSTGSALADDVSLFSVASVSADLPPSVEWKYIVPQQFVSSIFCKVTCDCLHIFYVPAITLP